MNFIIFASAVEYNLLPIFYLGSKQNLFIFDKFSNSISEKYYFFFILPFRISFCDAYFKTSYISTWMKHA